MYEPCTRTQANEFDPGDPEREREKEKEIKENRPRSALVSLRKDHGPFKSTPPELGHDIYYP